MSVHTTCTLQCVVMPDPATGMFAIVPPKMVNNQTLGYDFWKVLTFPEFQAFREATRETGKIPCQQVLKRMCHVGGIKCVVQKTWKSLDKA